MSMIGSRCTKCGLIQMMAKTCKSCGSVLVDPLRDPGSTQTYPKVSSAKFMPNSNSETLCCECRKPFLSSEMISYGNSWVCGGCKPVFVQKLKQGISLPGLVEYAGFWIRFGAKFIDGLILGVVSILIGTAISILALSGGTPEPNKLIAFQIIQVILQYGIAAAFVTWFLGKYGATPGKMACKLKVVTADNENVSYSKAFGRHFAEYLSAIVLGIGYLMSAFDEEKRSLHDRICNTRVVRV